MRNCDDVILRYTIGQQNTVTLSEFEESSKYRDFLWLAKMSVRSFQNWFPGARFVVLYNGHEFDQFIEFWEEMSPSLPLEVEYIDQTASLELGVYENPYSFYPVGVWWKWIPFRLDLNKHEIAVDTDILCLQEPRSWYEWLDGDASIVVAPDRFEVIKVNTCGDLYRHPVLRNKRPANCGIVGQRAGEDYGQRFFDITEQIRYGYTHDSLFITEQGAINLWIYSLELEGISHTILNFKNNAWLRDFLYFIHRNCRVETLHAVSWHKEIIREMSDVFENKIENPDYPMEDFKIDILKKSADLKDLHRYVLHKQLEPKFRGIEFYLV